MHEFNSSWQRGAGGWSVTDSITGKGVCGMKPTSTMFRVLLAGSVGLSTLVGTAGCSGNEQGPRGFNDADIRFAQTMIPHHEQAVEMATLAETRAADQEIKQVAAQVKTNEGREITTMTGWLKAWGMPTAESNGGMAGMAGMPGMASEQEMAQLKAANGVDFDRMFARMLIANYNGGIQMCREIKGAGLNTDVTALATTMEAAQ